MELNEGLKKILLAGVGAVAVTAETAKDVVDNLVKKGELTVEQGKVLNEELKQNAKEKVKEHVSVTVVKEYKDAMDAVSHMDPDELAALKARIAEAEKAHEEKTAAECEDVKGEKADTPCSGEGEENTDDPCSEETEGTDIPCSGDQEEKTDTQEG